MPSKSAAACCAIAPYSTQSEAHCSRVWARGARVRMLPVKYSIVIGDYGLEACSAAGAQVLHLSHRPDTII